MEPARPAPGEMDCREPYRVGCRAPLDNRVLALVRGRTHRELRGAKAADRKCRA